MDQVTKVRKLLWSSIFVTHMAKKYPLSVMLSSLLHIVCGNRYNCADKHDYNQRM